MCVLCDNLGETLNIQGVSGGLLSIQGVAGGIVNILGGGSMDYSE
jgi:hypothetical protein